MSNQNQPEKTLGEQDELCRKAGWPTISAQMAYWEGQKDQQIVATFEAIGETLKTLTASVEGLLAICKDQQAQIDRLKRFKRNETDESL